MLINNTTAKNIDRYKSRPNMPLILLGDQGSGKFFLAQKTAKEIIDSDDHKASSIMILRPNETGNISIIDTRELKGFFKLRTAHKSQKRIVIIKDAHLMSSEAQNSILKILEEAPLNSVIIITATNDSQILPTILSRVVRISVLPISEQQIINNYQNLDSSRIKSIWHISNGNAGIINQLINENNNDQEINKYIDMAKNIIKQNKFQKLTSVDKIIKDLDINKLLNALSLVVDAGYNASIVSNNKAQINKWHQIRQKINQSEVDININCSKKLVLTDLFLSM